MKLTKRDTVAMTKTVARSLGCMKEKRKSRQYLGALPAGPEEEADHVSQSRMLQKEIPSLNPLLS